MWLIQKLFLSLQRNLDDVILIPQRRRFSSSLEKNNIDQLHESYNNIINIFNLLFENLIY